MPTVATTANSSNGCMAARLVGAVPCGLHAKEATPQNGGGGQGGVFFRRHVVGKVDVFRSERFRYT